MIYYFKSLNTPVLLIFGFTFTVKNLRTQETEDPLGFKTDGFQTSSIVENTILFHYLSSIFLLNCPKY